MIHIYPPRFTCFAYSIMLAQDGNILTQSKTSIIEQTWILTFLLTFVEHLEPRSPDLAVVTRGPTEQPHTHLAPQNYNFIY